MGNLQKPATRYEEIRLSHRGILDPQEFARQFRLRCYVPSESMGPFVQFYFVSRRVGSDASYTPTDILTQPVVHLFFLSNGQAHVSGITSGKRSFTGDLYAGARFRPGGFRPFWQHPVSELFERRVPAPVTFPEADEAFTQRLLALPDDIAIIAAIEQLLKTCQPKADPRIEVINAILTAVDTDNQLTTVQAVARAFGLSERTLQQLFHAYVGCGLKWYLMRRRFLRALARAHSQPTVNWTAVAADLNYSTQSHFINEFKRLIGVSPGQYLKMLRYKKCSR